MDHTGDSQKVTDLEYLVKLSKGNEQFVREMIRIFLDENPQEISTLEKAIADRDFQLINAAAHKLRSTVPFVGIDKIISGEISEIEKLAQHKTGDPFKSVPREKLTKFLPTDKELLGKIESLFGRIKAICTRAYEELRMYSL